MTLFLAIGLPQTDSSNVKGPRPSALFCSRITLAG